MSRAAMAVVMPLGVLAGFGWVGFYATRGDVACGLVAVGASALCGLALALVASLEEPAGPR
jgi:hypothetical protein